MSNIVTFPGARPAANIRPVNLSFDYRPAPVGAKIEPWRQRPNMHTRVFRSYDLILASSEADLVRDVRLDVDKAQTKLNAIQQQLRRVTEQFAKRWKMLTAAENKMSAAIVAAKSLPPAPASILEPPRRTKSEALEHRRAFRAAMRQRIRDIAASRHLAEEEIKPALTLKHQEIARFTERHGVNLEWLLEGEGRIFKSDRPKLSTPMSGSEFAALVSTMAPADQRAVEVALLALAKARTP